MDLTNADFWVSLAQIIWIDLLLSGDNAVIIALAVRSLPAETQKKAIIIGTAAAILLRVVFTFIAAELLHFPWLKAVGAVLLIYIGVSLLFNDDDHQDHKETTSMLSAIRYILVADVIMSLDNVLAVAAAADGHRVLLIIGLLLSIPLVVFGSTLLLKLIKKYPIIVWIGAGLLGFIAGEMLVTDVGLNPYAAELAQSLGVSVETLKYISGAVFAIVVWIIGGLIMSIRKKRSNT